MADNSQRRRFSRDLSGLWTGYYAYDLTDDAIMFTAWIIFIKFYFLAIDVHILSCSWITMITFFNLKHSFI